MKAPCTLIAFGGVRSFAASVLAEPFIPLVNGPVTSSWLNLLAKPDDSALSANHERLESAKALLDRGLFESGNVH
jgi:hypothetical protein